MVWEVLVKYMKSWEKEAILIKETTEKVTEQVTAEVTNRDVHIYIHDMREMGASDEMIKEKLVENYAFDEEKADQMLCAVAG